MARIAQSTFQQRIARIEEKGSVNAAAYPKGSLMRPSRKKKHVHWSMLALGTLVGGIVGTFFAMRVGLLELVSLDANALYQLMLTDHNQAGLIIGVALAPVGFVISQLSLRGFPRIWQFWMAYFAAVLGSNSAEIQTFYEIVTKSAG